MTGKGLLHEINMEMVKYLRKHGKNADTLKLGKDYYKILIDHINKDVYEEGDDYTRDGENYVLWDMFVVKDREKEGTIVLSNSIVPRYLNGSFFELEECFAPYRMKMDEVVPQEFGEEFSDYIDYLSSWNNENIGITISTVRRETTGKGNVYYHMHISGRNKNIVESWRKFLHEVVSDMQKRNLSGE